MKNLYHRLNELQRMLILAGLVSIVLLLLSLIPLFAFNQFGWLIGVAIGSVIEIVNVTLLYKGSEFTLKRGKPYFFLLFYFVRMFLFLLGFLVTALLGFGFTYQGNVVIAPVEPFINSLWGVLIGYTPIQFVVIIVMLVSKRNPLTMSQVNERKE